MSAEKILEKLAGKEKEAVLLPFNLIGAAYGAALGAAGGAAASRSKKVDSSLAADAAKGGLAGAAALGLLAPKLPTAKSKVEIPLAIAALAAPALLGAAAARLGGKEKKALMSGMDGRSFSARTTNFPTKDSTSFANKQLQQSQAVAKPAPIKPIGLKDVVPKMPSNTGTLPKLGEADMERIKNDPLVQYLKQKHAEELQDNEDGMKTDAETPTMAESYVGPDQAIEGVVDTTKYLNKLFEHKEFRKKFVDKEE